MIKKLKQKKIKDLKKILFDKDVLSQLFDHLSDICEERELEEKKIMKKRDEECDERNTLRCCEEQ